MSRLSIVTLLATSLVLAGCGSSSGGGGSTAPQAGVHAAVALDTSGRLHFFETDDPDEPTRTLVVTGTATGEVLVDVDSRPSDGKLFAVADSGAIYEIDVATGEATQVSTSSENFTGATLDMAFDPDTDELHVSSDASLNVTITVSSGAAIRATNYFYAAGDVNAGLDAELSALAFAQGSGSGSVKYGIDTQQDVLVRESASAEGAVETVGTLGVDVSGPIAFDIAADGTAYLIAEVGSDTILFEVDLTTGATTQLSVVPSDVDIRGLALEVIPETPSATIHAVTRGNVLVRFNTDDPSTIENSVAISGMVAGEAVIAMDVRPSTHQLIAVTDEGRIYILDRDTGVATQIAATASASAGVSFGSDFDAGNDRLRIVSSAGQNTSLDVIAGTSTNDGALAFASGDVNNGTTADISALATSASSTFAVDGSLDVLARLDTPSTGELVTVGPLGVSATGELAFDFEAAAGAFLAIEGSSESELYTVDLSTGGATSLGVVAAGDVLVVIAIEPIPLDDTKAYLVNAANELITFATTAPMNVTSTVAISGLAAGEAVVAITLDPLTGLVTALTSDDRILRIDPMSGATTSAGATSTAVTSAESGIDVNPISGRLTIIGEQDQSLSTVIDATSTTTNPAVAYASGDVNFGTDAAITAIANTSSVAGATVSTLFGIDTATDALVRIDTTTGEVQTVGSLGFDAEFAADLDIRGGTERAYAALRKAGDTVTRLFVIDLDTGAAVEAGVMTSGSAVSAFSLGD